MKKNLLIAVFLLGAVIESFAMISPEDRSVSPRQGFRYSNRSIVVNKYGRLVIPKKFLKKEFNKDLLEDEELVLDWWLEWNDLPSNFFGGRPYGGNCKTGPQEYKDMVADLDQAQENEDKINELRNLSEKELQLWKDDLNSPNYFRDMKIVEMIFGTRKDKIKNAFLKPLQNRFVHELNELNVSLNNVKKELKNNPNNQILIDQKKLVKSEIKSFKNLDNRDSFYRSSMKRSDFNTFQQYRTRE